MSTDTPTTTDWLDDIERARHITLPASFTGRVAETVRIAPTGFIRMTKEARCFDAVEVFGDLSVKDRAFISGNARIEERASLTLAGDAYVTANVHVESGDVFLSDHVSIYHNARLHGGEGELYLYGTVSPSWNADLSSGRHIFSIGPVGSEGRTVTVYRAFVEGEWVAAIRAGCFLGTPAALEERLNTGAAWYDTDADVTAPWEADYRAIIEMARDRQQEWMATPPTEQDVAYWTADLRNASHMVQ